ncbi:cell adhesion molecule CEACAM4 isoform X21 [Homo sapiens]|uniref:cell adhesion molecule CEACAM4 isoform X21 n=1 Tax=Homo sapiens TaxID=9606 RepID=UPI0007DC5C05|nr:carcinoembryonic antigen-related cell adhesion molecule 4 isoform X21 [Homo sapiens]|eukprot:XP_016881692.1 carcinoembryonic antigen-related cell adhesion molecule 4 isoform X6 [Homo sapiens]
MGPPSAAPRGGHRPWQGLLITASLLTFWHPPTTVQFTIEALPSSAAEGKDVLLLACNISETIQAYYWHKGKTAEGSPLIAGYITDIQANIPGAAYSGRETVYPNGSLLFQNITLEDAGSYTLRTINASYDSDQATGQLHVHRPASSVTSGSSRPQPPPLEGPRLSSHPAAHSCLCPQAMVPLTDPPSRPLYPAPEQPLPSMRCHLPTSELVPALKHRATVPKSVLPLPQVVRPEMRDLGMRMYTSLRGPCSVHHSSQGHLLIIVHYKLHMGTWMGSS